MASEVFSVVHKLLMASFPPVASIDGDDTWEIILRFLEVLIPIHTRWPQLWISHLVSVGVNTDVHHKYVLEAIELNHSQCVHVKVLFMV